MVPEWLSVGLMVAAWGLGFRGGWALMDRWLTPRDRPMRNVTPRD